MKAEIFLVSLTIPWKTITHSPYDNVNWVPRMFRTLK